MCLQSMFLFLDSGFKAGPGPQHITHISCRLSLMWRRDFVAIRYVLADRTCAAGGERPTYFAHSRLGDAGVLLGRVHLIRQVSCAAPRFCAARKAKSTDAASPAHGCRYIVPVCGFSLLTAVVVVLFTVVGI